MAILLTMGITAQASFISVQQWTFDTDLSEANGGTAGTAVGDAAVQATAGQAGGAVYFDGDNDAVWMNGSVVPTGSVSFSFWSKTDGSTTGYFLCDGGEVHNFFLRRASADPTKYNGEVAYTDSIDDNFIDFGPYAEDVWHHNVLVSDLTTNEQFWYVDGVLAEQRGPYAGPTVGVLQGFVTDLYLGNRTDLKRDFKGWIDDLQIYDGPLDAAQVAYMYNNPGEVATIPEPSTMALLFTALLGLFVLRRRK